MKKCRLDTGRPTHAELPDQLSLRRFTEDELNGVSILVGLDAGTTGCKTCVLDFQGSILGSDHRTYPCYYPKPGWVEQKAEDMIPNLFDSIKQAIAKSGIGSTEIMALGLSSQGSTIGLIGENNELLYDFIVWQDLRGANEFMRVLDRVSTRIVRMPWTRQSSWTRNFCLTPTIAPRMTRRSADGTEHTIR